MTIRTYKVTLDSKNTIAPEPVFLRQGDKTGAVVIDATLMDNGSPVSLNGLNPMFKANTADGKSVIADSTGFNIVNASGGELTYQVPNALSAVPGKITTAYFSFSDSSGSESTFDVAFIIKKAVDITKPQADDYITIIDGTLQSLQQKINAMNTNVQTILNAYNQGDFYNKTQTDSKDAATLASAKSYADTQDATGNAGAAEVVSARSSSVYGNFATLDARLEKIEAVQAADSTKWQSLTQYLTPAWVEKNATDTPLQYKIDGQGVWIRGEIASVNALSADATSVVCQGLPFTFDGAQKSTQWAVGTNGFLLTVTGQIVTFERYHNGDGTSKAVNAGNSFGVNAFFAIVK